MSKYKIPGWLWLIAGIGVAVLSKVISARDASNAAAMTLFFYVGLLFIAVGIFKILIKVILSNKKNKIIVNKRSKKISSEKNNKGNRYEVIYCSNCGSKNYAFFNYCQNCGKKLK